MCFFFFLLAAKNEADRQAEKREIKRRLTRKVLLAVVLPLPSGRAVGAGGGSGHVAGTLLRVKSRGCCVTVPGALGLRDVVCQPQPAPGTAASFGAEGSEV